jgi:NitT/TauT family transport system permease protein
MKDQAFAERSVAALDQRKQVAVGYFVPTRAVLERTLALASPLVLLVVWEALVRVGALDARFFPAPSDILATLWRLTVSGQLVGHVAISLLRTGIGFVLGAVPGVVVGLTLGLFTLPRAALWPTLGALYPIPKIAILPLVVLVFGLGEASKWVIIAIGVFFPLAINTMAGVMSIDKIYHDVGRNFGASRLNHYRTIALPGALPLILAGVRIGWGTALLLMVTAEFVAAKSGLGYLIWQGWQSFAIEQMYVGIILVSLLGYVSFVILDQTTRVIVPWKPEAIE